MQVLFAIDIPQNALDDLEREFGKTYEFIRCRSKQEALDRARDADILVMISATKDIISLAVKCNWIHVLTAGVEQFLEIDSIANKKSMLLTNSSGVHGIPIAEHVFSMLLVLARRMKPTLLMQEEARWEQPFATGSTDIFELFGSTIGIIGLGHIGLEIAKRSKAFGMRVIGVRRDHSASGILGYSEFVDELLPPSKLDDTLEKSDIVVNALPLTRETYHIFDKSKFSKFKTGSVFVNVGRGQTVVESDLIEALHSQKLRFAALDVFEKEPLPADSALWKMNNVIISPHYAGWSPMYFVRAFGILRENLRRYAKGETLLNMVDKSRGY
ncbi:MAG: D-2-hydroxyacid dehydrogenase [Thaumarchaeota archaeon]|nr:D-2-hydroxyacid dehydrogenase [Nitrososphaerota archaeon]